MQQSQEMESIGDRLRKERKRRGLSIEEVAAVTKIQPKFIQALEENQFEIFSASVFIKGSLRTYASFLRMNPEELVELYKKQFDPQTTQKSLAKEGSVGTFLEVEALPVGHKKRSRRPFRRVILFLFLLLGLYVLGLYVHGRWQGLQKPPKSQKQQEKSRGTALRTVPKGQGSPSASSGRATRGAFPEGRAPERRAEALLPAEQKASDAEILVLSITAQRNTWMRIEIDGQERRELFLKAGQSRDWKANEGFTLTVGNVKGVSARLNGKAVALPEGHGGVLRDFRIDRERLR